MNLLLLTQNKSCYETMRLQEEAKKMKHILLISRPNELSSSIESFKAVLIRSIQGQTQKAKELAEKALKKEIAVVDEKLASGEGATKYGNYKKFVENKISTPKTLLLPIALKKINLFNSRELVIKPTTGKQGKNLFRIKNDLTELKKFFESVPLNKRKKFMVSEFIEIEKEYRVFVIGEKAIAGFYKETDSWVHNFSQGAKPVAVELTPELISLSVKAAQCVKNEICGVDIAETKQGLTIIEANRAPGFEGLEKATGKNIAKKIIEYMEKKAGKK
ncbi:MAG: ATP-grasp domain-containing protein [Candidatus Diapherotrites archaeon]|nr:ATP-grasp domain-containing protein [Candidatus Diapherotrites archaeon]